MVFDRKLKSTAIYFIDMLINVNENDGILLDLFGFLNKLYTYMRIMIHEATLKEIWSAIYCCQNVYCPCRMLKHIDVLAISQGRIQGGGGSSGS